MQVSILDISLHTSGEGYVDYGATIKKGTQDCETLGKLYFRIHMYMEQGKMGTDVEVPTNY